jgi:hypothetical protein
MDEAEGGGGLGEELAIPQKQLGGVTFIVPLYIGKLHPVIRRVLEVAFVQPDGDSGLTSTTIASWDLGGDSFEVLSREEDRRAFASWAGLTVEELNRELDDRESVLGGLLEKGATAIPEVNAAIESFYELRLAGGRPAQTKTRGRVAIKPSPSRQGRRRRPANQKSPRTRGAHRSC